MGVSMVTHIRILFLALVASPAFAIGDLLVTTEGAVSYELHQMPSNAMVPGPWPTSEADCLAKAKASAGKWACVTRRNFETVASCQKDAPEIKLEKNAEGFLVQPGIVVEALPDGSWAPTKEEGYVLKPYPQCWVLGLVPYTGKWIAEEGPPVMEPICRPDDVGCPP